MTYLRERSRQQDRDKATKKVAILGCGYVGTALASYWRSQGLSITGTTTSLERVATLANVANQVVLMNANDASAVHSLLQDQDLLVVSVAPTGSIQVNDTTYAETYLNTTQNLAMALQQAPNIKQVIYLSSCSVYRTGSKLDLQGDLLIDETAQLDPSEPRSQILHEAEKLLLQVSNANQRVCLLRLGGIYGPGRELVKMFGRAAGTTMPGTGQRIIQWTHQDDIIGAIEFARRNKLQGIYNLVDDNSLSLKELMSQLCEQYHLPAVYWDPSQPDGQQQQTLISNQKIKGAGYQLIHPQPQL